MLKVANFRAANKTFPANMKDAKKWFFYENS